MAATVDERIVAAKFDASDFEKGVDKTLKKLDELKKSLDLKEATKGVKELAEKTKDSTNSLSNSLEKLTDRFTTFTGMIKQKILSGLADEVANVFLTMEQRVKSFIKSISSDQLAAGMNKYEQILTSVRVMMSAGQGEVESYEAIERLQEYSDETSYSLSQMTDAMSKMVAAGVDLKTATKNVEGIANACANAGINATDAQRAFFNLSQAFSSGSLKYTDYRSLELLNMTTAEFKNAMLESAEAAGTLKKIGDGMWVTINKNDKKVTAGKKVTEKNLSDMLRYNFMNTNAMNQLFGNKYWMEVIGREELEKTKKEFQALYGDNWEAELEKKYGKLAVTAFEAAKEARNFTDVVNALKDAVSTGWSKTFEYFFGKLGEASNFFTKLANGELADVVYKIGEYRNAILEMWSGFTTNGESFGGGELFRQSILNISNALGTLIKTFLNVLPGFDAFEEDEEGAKKTIESLGAKMFDMTMTLRDFSNNLVNAADNFSTFMNTPFMENGPTRIELIRSVLGNLLSVFKVVGKVIGVVSIAFEKAYQTLTPLFDGLLVFLSKITEPLSSLSENKAFKDIEDSIKNIFNTLDPISKVLGKIIAFLGDVAAFFVNMAIDTAVSNISFFSDVLALFLELITGKSSQMEKGEGILKRIGDDFAKIKEACEKGIVALKEFFGTIISDLKKIFGLTGNKKDQNGGVFSGVIGFFETNEFVKKAKDWVNKAVVDIGNFIKSIPSKLKVLGANVYDVIRKLLFTREQEEQTGEEKEILTPLGEWLNKTIAEIKQFVLDIPNKIVAGIGKVFNWVDTVFDVVFGTGKKTEASEKEKKETEDAVMAQFDDFIDRIRASIAAWFVDLPNKIDKAFGAVGGFFKNLVNAIDEFMFGKKETKTVLKKGGKDKGEVVQITKRIKSGFSAWLDTMIDDIQKFLKKIPEYIQKGIKGVGDIISMIVSGIFGTKNGEETKGKDIEDKIKKPLLDINLESILKTIKDIGWNIINQIARIFTDTEDIDKNKVWLKDKINDAINWVVSSLPGLIHSAWAFIKRMGINVWTGIKGIFNEQEVNDDSPIITKAVQNVGLQIKEWLTNADTGLPHYIDEAWEWLKKTGKTIWSGLRGAFIDGGIDGYESDLAQKVYDIGTNIKIWLTDDKTGLPSYINAAWEWLKQTGHNVWVGLKSIFSSEGMPSDNHSVVAEFINTVGTKIREWFTNDQDGFPHYFDLAWTAVKEFGHNMWTGFKSIFSEDSLPEENQSTVASFVSNLGTRIKEWFTDDQNGFPAVFRTAWKAVSDFKSGVFEGIAAVFSGNIPQSEVGKAIADVGNKLKTFITVDLKDSLIVKIPEFLRSIWAGITSLAGDLWEGLSGIFSGDIPESEIGLAVYEIGNKIKTFILVDVKDYLVKNIPDFIHSAWDALVSLGTDIFAGFASIFTGATPKNETQRAIADFGKMVKNFIVTDLPKMIIEAFEEISKVFNNAESSTISDDVQKTNDVVFGEVVDETLKAQNNADKELNGETKKSGFWTFAENLKNSFLEVLSSIGPAILNGIASALDWIGKIATYVMDAITGENDIGSDIEKAFGKEAPDLKKALSHIGESLKNFFLDTLPKFIGTIIGTISKEAPIWFGKLFGAITTAEAEAEKNVLDPALEGSHGGRDFDPTEAAIESATNVMDVLKIIFSKLNSFVGENSDALVIAAVIISLTMLFSRLSDLFGMADELEEGSRLVKWTAITLAIAAIAGIMSYVSKLVDSNDQNKIDNFKEIIDKIGNVLLALGAVMGLNALGKFGDALGNRWEGGVEKLSGVEKLVSGVTTAFNDFLAAFGIGAGAGLGLTVAGWGIDNFMSSVTSAFDSLSKGIDDELEIILPCIDNLVKSESKLSMGISAIDKLKELFVKFYTAFSELYGEASGGSITDPENGVVAAVDKNGNAVNLSDNNVSASIRAYIDDLTERLDIFTHLTDFVQSLSAALKGFKDFNSVEDIESEMTKIIDMLNSKNFTVLVHDLIISLNKSIADKDFKYLPKSYASIMDTLSGAISGIASGVSMLKDSDISNLDKVTTAFTGIASAFGNMDWIKQNGLSNLGREIKWFGSYTKNFSNSISEITGYDDINYAETKRKLDSVFEIAKALSEIAMKLNTQYTPDSDVLATYSEKLPGFGEAVGQFFTRLNNAFPNDIDSDRVHSLYEASGVMSNMLVAVKDLANLFLQYNNLTVDEILNQVLSSTNKVSAEGTETAGKFATIFVRFTQAISKSLDDDSMLEEFKQLGSKFYIKLNEGIQAAIDEDPSLQPKITPVLDLEPAKGQLRQFFGVDQMPDVDLSAMARSAFGANAQTDEDRVTYTLLSGEIAKVTASIDALKNSQVTPVDISNAFAGMRVVTDTGALVGALTNDIDAAIGRKIWLIERGVAPDVGFGR